MTLLSTAALLFFILDPFGNVPKFLVALRGTAREQRDRIMVRELAIALSVMVVFLFVGQHLLDLMHVTEKSLSVGGGLLLLMIAFRMVFPAPVDPDQAGEPEPFIVPLAIPYFAGPATLATVAVLGSSEPGRIWVWLAAIFLAWLAASTVILLGSRIAGVLGSRGLIAIERVMGMLLIAIAVEMLFTGVASFVTSLPA